IVSVNIYSPGQFAVLPGSWLASDASGLMDLFRVCDCLSCLRRTLLRAYVLASCGCPRSTNSFHLPESHHMKPKPYFILLGSAILLSASGQAAKSVVHNSVFQSNAARNSQAQPCVDRSNLLAAPSISPFDLEKYLNERDESEDCHVNFKPIWRKLKIPR